MALHCPHCDGVLPEVEPGDETHTLCMACGAPVLPADALWVPDGDGDQLAGDPALDLGATPDLAPAPLPPLRAAERPTEAALPAADLEPTLDVAAEREAPRRKPLPPATPVPPLVRAPVAQGSGAEPKPPMPEGWKAQLVTTLKYPFASPIAFLLLVIVTGVFAAFRGFSGGWAWALSRGIVLWYSFHAMFRVSNGDLRFSMPEFRDRDTLFRPMRLAFAALLVSSLPLFVVNLWAGFGDDDDRRPRPVSVRGPQAPRRVPAAPPPPVDSADDEDAEEPEPTPVPNDPAFAPATRGAPKGPSLAKTGAVLVAAVAAIGWRIVIMPAALMVAGLTQSFFSTLFPLAAIGMVRAMGRTFWKAAAIFTGISLFGELAVLAAELIPAGTLVLGPFIEAYVALATGCVLGMAIHEKTDDLHFA